MPRVWVCVKSPEEASGSSAAGITEGYELPDVEAGDLT